MAKFAKVVLPLWAITLIPATAAAQDTRLIIGLVRDSVSGEALAYASVSVPETHLAVATNPDGFFTLAGAPDSALTIRITHIGYAPAHIRVEPDHRGVLEVVMSPLPVELEGVEFVADEYRLVRATTGVSRITASPAEMALLPSVGEVDVFRSLQLLPGISGTRESSSGLYVRGGTPDQNLVLLDGITVYHVDHFFGFFSAFNAEAIKDIQVFKGAFPARYGGRVSSVVDLTGKTGDPEQLRYGVGLNLLSGNVSLQVPVGPKATVLVTARRSYTDIVKTGLYSSIFDVFDGDEGILAPGGGAGPPGGGGFGGPGGPFGGTNQAAATPDFYFYDANAKLTLFPSDHDVMAFSLYGGRDYLDKSQSQSLSFEGRGGVGTQGFSSQIFDLTDWGNRGVSGRWSRQWSTGIATNLLAAYSEYASDYGQRSLVSITDAETGDASVDRELQTTEENFLTDLTFRLDSEWRPWAAHNFEFGGWLTSSEASYRYVRDDSVTILDQFQRATSVAAYVQDTWDIGPRLSLTVGSRAAHYGETGTVYLEPRASLRFDASQRLTLKAAGGRYHQFVNRVVNENVTEGSRDFWLLADGDLVDVTSSDHLVLGASYETEGFLFDVEGYRKTTSGLTEFALRFQRLDPDPLNLFFEGSGVSRGVEVLAQKKFGRLTGWLAYTLSESENTFPQLNDGEPFPALHDQRHELKAVGTFSVGRWDLGSTWTFGSGTPYTAPQAEYQVELLDGSTFSYINVSEKNGFRLPAYHRLDLSANYNFRLAGYTSSFGASVFNLYGRDNVWYRQFQLDVSPAVVTDVNYLGRVLNLSFRFDR